MSSQLVESYRLAVKKEHSIRIYLNTKVLRDSICSNYVPVIDFLKEKGVMDRNESYFEGCYSRTYWLTDEAINKGLKKVEITDNQLLSRITSYHNYLLEKVNDNTITQYLIDEVYPSITLPDNKMILEEGKM